MVNRLLSPYCLCILLLGLLTLSDGRAEVTVSPDTLRATAGVPFHFSIEVTGENTAPPDISVFAPYLTIMNSNHVSRSNTVIRNGRRSTHTQRTYVYTAVAHTPGAVTIDGVSAGNETSAPIVLSVIGNGIADDAVLYIAHVEKDTVYVQQTVVVDFQLLIRVPIDKPQFATPTIDGAEAVVRALPDVHEGVVMHQGKQYRAYRKRYAITPQQSGTITVQPVVFSGYIDTTFFHRVQTEPITITVEPVPVGATADNWLVADAVTVSAALTHTRAPIRVGDALTYITEVVATGATAAQLPDIVPKSDVFSYYAGANVDEERIDASDLIGMKRQTFTLIARQSGTLTLPDVAVQWWDAATGHARISRAQHTTITVLPAETTHATQSVHSAAPMTLVPVSVSPEYIASTKKQAVFNDPFVRRTVLLAAGAGALLSAVLFGLFFVVRRFIRGRSTRARRQVVSTSKKNAAWQRALQTAVATRDARAAKAAILHWARDRYDADTAGSIMPRMRTYADLSPYLTDDDYAAVCALDRACYGATDAASAVDWARIAALPKQYANVTPSGRDTALAPLR